MPKKQKKRRGKIKVTQKARIKKKSEQENDTIPRMEARPPADAGATFKVKIRKK